MREIALSKGHVALVDDEDYGRVSAHKWCAVAVEHYGEHAKLNLLRRAS